jgi:hypothetical protein
MVDIVGLYKLSRQDTEIYFFYLTAYSFLELIPVTPTVSKPVCNIQYIYNYYYYFYNVRTTATTNKSLRKYLSNTHEKYSK